MVKKKRQSKRVTLKDKYKIEKKVKEHNRKQRREQRKRAQSGVTLNKSKKGLGLPNLMPFKEKFIQQLMDDKEREKERERQRLVRLRAMRNGEGQEAEEEEDMEMEEEEDDLETKRRSGPSASDLENAAERAAQHELKMQEKEIDMEENGSDALTKGKKRMYMKELRNVVDASDVVLLVLDARDPMGCRAPQAEKMVLENARNKRLIFVLNKIDLVPKQVVERWLTELRKEFPTVAFRASTQMQKSNLGRASKDSIGLGTSSSSSGATIGDSLCVGADTLLQLLKNYSRNRDIKTSITVGVIGYPNVGKSSIINSLKRTRAVGVSPTAGFTKTLQIVQLDKKVKLIDSPGVLFQDSSRSDKLVLRNCLNAEELEDPTGPVTKLLDKCDSQQLMLLYNLPRFASSTELLVSLAHKRGKLSKGGVPDQKAAARLVLQDWNAGKIPFFVMPPEQSTTQVTSSVVTEWAKEFDLDALMAKEKHELVEHLPSHDPNDFAAVF